MSNGVGKYFSAKDLTVVGPTRLQNIQVARGDTSKSTTSIGTLDLPGSLLGQPTGSGTVAVDRMYAATTTVWVEPYTGAIVQGGQHAVQWAQENGQKVLELADVNFLNTPATVASVADQITSKRVQLEMVKFWVPVVGPIVGVLFVVLALFLLLRRTREPELARSTASALASA